MENRKQLHSRAERRHSNVISSSRAFAKKLVQEQNTGKDIPLPLVSSIPNILHRALSSIRSDELSYNETKKKKKKKKEKTMYRHPRGRRETKRERERERESGTKVGSHLNPAYPQHFKTNKRANQQSGFCFEPVLSSIQR